MRPERHERIGELFVAAGRLPPGERSAFLAVQCAGDVELRAEVESLLAHADSDFAQRIGVAAVVDLVESGLFTSTDGLPESIGGFRILALLGRGGMGVVYEAEQENPRRTVALKVIRRGMLTPSLAKRFAREAQVLGRLQHRGIAQIYGAGSDDSAGQAQPFFAMELVRGRPLVEWADAQGLDLRRRLALLAEVCDAVQHAHQKGVVHRDLKPANVLVDGDGQPKVLDFGIARITDADVQVTSQGTREGEIVGTLAYMSPEQVAGRSADVDERADVYALGAMAYELASGQLPLDVLGRSIPEAVRRVAEDEPTGLGTLDSALRGDVATIVAKALEKDRARRYASAAELAADLRRFLADEPIAARPASTIDQLAKFTRRNRALVTGLAIAFVALLTGTIVSTSLYFEAEHQRELEADARRDADLALAAEAAARRETAEAFAAEAEAKRVAQRRAQDLERVSDFQAAQFMGIDAPAMGLRLRRDVLDEAAAGMQLNGLPPADVRARLAELERLLAGTNFTNLALSTLDQAFFERSLEAIGARFADQPLVEAALLQSLAGTLRHLGLIEPAIAPQERAFALRREHLGPEHEDTLESMRESVILLVSRGRGSEAEALALECLELTERIQGADHPNAIALLRQVGQALRAQERNAEALDVAREVEQRAARVYAPGDPELWTIRQHHALALSQAGEIEASVAVYRELLADLAADGQSSSFLALASKDNLANQLTTLGKTREALELRKDTLTGFRATLGDDHPHTLISLNQLGLQLWRVGLDEEAAPYLRESMQTHRRVFGDTHTETLGAINNYALILVALGSYAEAEPYCIEVVEGHRARDGSEHVNTLGAVINLGQIYRYLGRFEEARVQLDESLPIALRVLGLTHDYTLVALWEIAQTYDGLGLTEASLAAWAQFLESCLTLAEAPNASANKLGFAAEQLLLVPHLTLRDPVRAQALLERAIGFEEQFGGLQLWTQHSRLALAHHHLGDHAAAIASQRRAIELAPQREISNLKAVLEEYEAVGPKE